MLGGGDSSAVLGSSGDEAAAVAATDTIGTHDGGGGGSGEVGSNSGEEDKGIRGDEMGDRSFGGNRWPRQETLALLKIRSDMDQVFRDSSLKGPLWEEVSRKMGELGYNRSAKKCKEKFENVYKYHKRTKDGRSGKSEGKNYKFFEQLQALDHQNHHHHSAPPPPKPHHQATPIQAMPWPHNVSHINVPSSTTTNPINATPITTNPTISTAPATIHHMNSYNPSSVPASFPNVSAVNLFSSSTSSSTASDDEPEKEVGKRKRKWKVFFKRLTRQVIKKQEELQNKFLETIEKRENERMVREEAWRIQEMARINREHEILIQERSTAAAKDAAVIAFLQKISGQNPVQTRENILVQPPPPTPILETAPRLQTQPQSSPAPPPRPAMAINLDSPKPANGESVGVSSSSRWPKAEVQALIKFRTELSVKYQENGPKGPLWEEISAAMRSLGYNRSAKRCKEKWENINKYFKKVKESNKKRPQDSKTCPYFTQLDALYKEKSKNENSGYGVKPINPMVPLMVQPEQQWPLHQENNQHPPTVMDEDMETDNVDQIHEDDEEEDGDTEEEYEGGGYEIVANKAASMGTTE